MKRYVKSSGWYTGEPSEYNKHGHSVYSNPDNYKEKQTEILQFLGELAPNYPDGWYRPNVTPSVVMIQSMPYKELFQKNKYFKFDLWEDERSLEEQEADFIDWADMYAAVDTQY